MNENVRALLDAIKEDEQLARQIASSDKDDAIAIALSAAEKIGIPLSKRDFSPPEGELSEEELTAVAGGGVCFCEIGGGGTSEDKMGNHGIDNTCGCVFGGYGSGLNKNGETETRCACVQLGSGASYR